MSILNITNLTDNPKKWITDKYEDAFNELEKELNVHINNQSKEDFIDSQIESLEEQADETLGKDLLGLIDNYLVNLDYYSEVKEWYGNKIEIDINEIDINEIDISSEGIGKEIN